MARISCLGHLVLGGLEMEILVTNLLSKQRMAGHSSARPNGVPRVSGKPVTNHRGTPWSSGNAEMSRPLQPSIRTKSHLKSKTSGPQPVPSKETTETLARQHAPAFFPSCQGHGSHDKKNFQRQVLQMEPKHGFQFGTPTARKAKSPKHPALSTGAWWGCSSEPWSGTPGMSRSCQLEPSQRKLEAPTWRTKLGRMCQGICALCSSSVHLNPLPKASATLMRQTSANIGKSRQKSASRIHLTQPRAVPRLMPGIARHLPSRAVPSRSREHGAACGMTQAPRGAQLRPLRPFALWGWEFEPHAVRVRNAQSKQKASVTRARRCLPGSL